MTVLSNVDQWLLGRSTIEVASPLSALEAVAALNGLNRGSSNSFVESLQLEVIGGDVVARYRRARSEIAMNAIMNSFRCTFHGHIEVEADGCRLRGRFALPWMHVAMALIGLVILATLIPTTFMQSYDAGLWSLVAPVILYCVVAVPVARADIPFIERNLRYALTGSNDGG